MRKLTALFLCTCCLLVGCGQSKSVPSQQNTPYFMLDALPDIGEYVDDVVCNRRYPEFRDYLVPGENYGQLIPYAGSFKPFHYVNYETGQWMSETMSIAKYGLMTTTGQIVLDPVFDWYDITELENGEYIIQLYESGETDYTTERMLFCNADGSWVMEADTQLSFDFSAWNEGLIIATDYRNVNYDIPNGGPAVYFYDTQGNILFHFTNCSVNHASGFHDGYLMIQFYTDHAQNEYESYFLDAKGNLSFRQVHPGDVFLEGLAPAMQAQTGLWGIFTAQGTWLIQPTYDRVYREENCYIAQIGLNYSVYDLKGQYLYSFTEPEDTDYYLVGRQGNFFWENNIYDDASASWISTFRNVRTGEILTQKQTGTPVTNLLYGSDYFYLHDNQNTYLVDVHGNTLAALPGVGQPEVINDTYFTLTEGDWDAVKRTLTMYTFDGFQKLWSVTYGESGESVNYWSYGNYMIRNESTAEFLMRMESIADLLDLKSGKALLTDLTDINLCTIADQSYVYCSDGIYTYTYGPQMQLLMKIRNSQTD